MDMFTDKIPLTPIRSPEALGRLIRRVRKSRGFTQQQLAERGGRRRQAIISQEAGVSTAALNCLFDSLAVLGYEIRLTPRNTERTSLLESAAGAEAYEKSWAGRSFVSRAGRSGNRRFCS